MLYLVKISNEKEIQYFKNAFDDLDRDKNGVIGVDELSLIYGKLGVDENIVFLFLIFLRKK